MTTTPIVENTPPGTQAAMIAAVLNADHPKLALPTIAANFSVTLRDLQTILQRAGYPDPARMRIAAATLRSQAFVTAGRADIAAALADQTPTEPRYIRVPVDQLHADPDNLREHVHGVASTDERKDGQGLRDMPVDDIEQLADSIREVGLLQPIVARRTDDGRLVVVAGHRRLAAIQRLRWTHVDVVVRPPMRPDHVVAAMLIENGQRRDLDPIEEARGLRKLKTTGLTDGDLARKVGRSQSYVSMRLALLLLSPEEQEKVRTGELTRTGAADLARLRAGKTRNGSKGNISIPYFGPTNDLASRAAARCKRLRHARKISGGVACGACWESVIRADERDHLQVLNAHAGDCVTCGHPIDHEKADA